MEILVDEQLKEIEELFSQGKKEESLKLVRLFLDKEPHNLRGLNNLGSILLASGDKAGAEDAFRRAFDLASNHWLTGVNLALCLGSREKWSETRVLAQKLLAVNQNEPQLWALLGRMEKSQGHIEAAINYFDQALVLDPDQPKLQQIRAQLTKQLETGSPPSKAKG